MPESQGSFPKAERDVAVLWTVSSEVLGCEVSEEALIARSERTTFDLAKRVTVENRRDDGLRFEGPSASLPNRAACQVRFVSDGLTALRRQEFADTQLGRCYLLHGVIPLMPWMRKFESSKIRKFAWITACG
jgi:hypothetical protein